MTDEEKLISVIRGNGEITQKQMSQKTGLPPPFYIFHMERILWCIILISMYSAIRRPVVHNRLSYPGIPVG